MAAFQIGRLIGTLLTPLLFMLIIGTIYYFIKGRSISFRQAILNPWVIGASVVLFVLGLIGQASSNLQQDTSHVYPERDVKEFTAGCVESAKAKLDGKVAEKICSCAISEIQKTNTYGEFKKLGQEMDKSKVLPPSFKDAITSCAKQHARP